MRDEPSPFGPGDPPAPSLRYLFLRFLRIGFLAWGGPFAQIGLMHRELVARDRWVSEERFAKTLALYQALPGPEAHELAVWFGMVKRGRAGGFLTGLAFMLPGVVLVTLLAALYAATAATSGAAYALLYGVRPAVAALVALGFARLARASLKGPVLAAIAIGAAAAGVLVPQANFLLLLAAGGAVALAAERLRAPARLQGSRAAALAPVLLAAAFPAAGLAGMLALAKVSAEAGLLSFGGAYTALPFLHRGAVLEQGWLTDAQFADALALAGLVPGPLIALGTFVGYLAAGLPGALLATLVIFAPAFAFTLLGHEHFERAVREPRLHAFLLGVTAAVVGLVVVALLPLARAAVTDAATALLALAALALLAWGRVPIPLVLAGAAAAGLAAQGLA